MLYKFIVYLHVLSTIITIGPFFALLPLVKKMRKADDAKLGIYVDMFRIAVSLSKHGGHVLVTTGILLIILSAWTWRTSWIVATIVILLSSLFFLARAFSPTLKKISEANGDKQVLISKLHRSTWIYILLLVIVLWLMVAKPMLW